MKTKQKIHDLTTPVNNIVNRVGKKYKDSF